MAPSSAYFFTKALAVIGWPLAPPWSRSKPLAKIIVRVTEKASLFSRFCKLAIFLPPFVLAQSEIRLIRGETSFLRCVLIRRKALPRLALTKTLTRLPETGKFPYENCRGIVPNGGFLSRRVGKSCEQALGCGREGSPGPPPPNPPSPS